MKAPAFWARRDWRSALLLPAAWLYRITDGALRSLKRPYRAPVPVICVGNLTVGGSGKTPTVIYIIGQLIEQGRAVHVVSRGYGGSQPGPLAVDLAHHSAAEVGDEPLLIAAYAPTWIARDRAAGVKAAVAAGAEVVVLDDGFQNPSVEKDLSIIVVDAGFGFGNRRTLPAGPLREPVAAGMARADAVLLIGTPQKAWPEVFHEKPVLRASLAPKYSGISLDGARVLAFAGIGRPEKFFQTVRSLGAEIVESESFADHQVYSRVLVERLLARAEAQDLMVVTTEKDAVKLPSFTRGKIWPVPVGLEGEDLNQINNLLSQAKASVASQPPAN
jgi:tetraacyldisaccharide 4'-kinase